MKEHNAYNIEQSRNYGIELFRVLASVMVVAIHVGGYCFDFPSYDWQKAAEQKLFGGGGYSTSLGLFPIRR